MSLSLSTIGALALALSAGAASWHQRFIPVVATRRHSGHQDVRGAAGQTTRAEVLVRSARLDGEPLCEQAHLMIRIAPVEQTEAVLTVAHPDGTDDTFYYASDVVAARAWCNGSQVLGSKRTETTAGPTLKPILGGLAAWELEVQFRSGAYVRVYAPTGTADGGLARLQTRLARPVDSPDARRTQCRPALGTARPTSSVAVRNEAPRPAVSGR